MPRVRHRSASRSTSRAGAIALAAALAVTAACSGGDDASTTTTAPAVITAAAPGATASPSAAAPLFGSLGGFVAAFNGIGESGAIQGSEPFVLDEATLITGPLASGANGFLATDVIPSGLLGGTLDADGAVTAVFVFVDPTTLSAAPAVTSLLGTMIATPASFDEAAFAAEYRDLAVDAPFRADDQTWSASDNGSGHSLVTTVVAGVSGGNNLIEVAVVPIADEAAAKAAVKPIRNEVIGLASR